MLPLSSPSLVIFSLLLFLSLSVNHVSNLSSSSLHFSALLPSLPFPLSLSASHSLPVSWHQFLFLCVCLSGCWFFVTLPVALTSSRRPGSRSLANHPTLLVCIEFYFCFFSGSEFIAWQCRCNVSVTLSLIFPQAIVTFESKCLT